MEIFLSYISLGGNKWFIKNEFLDFYNFILVNKYINDVDIFVIFIKV